MNTIIAMRAASERAKREKQWAFRQYRIGMAEIAGEYPAMYIVREMYRMGALPPVFPLPVTLEVADFDLEKVWLILSLDKAKREAKCFRAFRKHFMRKFLANYRTSGQRWN